MISLVPVAALWFAVAPPLDEASVAEPDVGQIAAEILQVTVQQIIIRVQRPGARVPAAGNIGWREASGPRCIAARQIAGALPSANNVDLIMRDNSRIRARLGQRCAALDYYRGLYVDANPDGQLCAGRDEVRSRMGGQCAIVQFRTLRPAVRVR